jgi:hypothetical protein
MVEPLIIDASFIHDIKERAYTLPKYQPGMPGFFFPHFFIHPANIGFARPAEAWCHPDSQNNSAPVHCIPVELNAIRACRFDRVPCRHIA